MSSRLLHERSLQSVMGFLQVQKRIKLCGQQLLRDNRIKCAQAHVNIRANQDPPRADSDGPLAGPERSRAAQSGPGADTDRPRQLVSLAAVAKQAQQGQFKGQQAFSRAVRKAVAGICLAAEGKSARQNKHLRGGGAG